ncbi:MAG: GNAT family N-acetyltransferase [Opitutales bacterium]|nr:GNAT family N-acetyltransferase [Opitutales bacterium]
MEFKIGDENFILEHAEEIASLSRDAYREHLEKNINFAATKRTADDIRRIGKGAFLSYAVEGDKIVGCVVFHINREKKTAHGENYAVSPAFKGQKIGMRLAESLCRFLAEEGIDVYKLDTSTKTPHVINFHKKYGCKIVGMASWPNTNYYSVILRKAINPHFEITDEEADARLKKSEYWCKKCFKEDGSRTLVGGVFLLKTIIFKIKRLWSSVF